MKYLIVICLVLFSGCGPLKFLSDFDDEIAGTPIRPLEQPVPDHSELPTPAEAAKIEKPKGLYTFSSVGFYSRGKLWSYWKVEANQFWDVRQRTSEKKMNYANILLWEDMNKAATIYYILQPRANRLEIWDISPEFGGNRGGHVSHQNGLDVDVKLPLLTESKGSSFDNIDLYRAWDLAVAFVATGNINRIFTDKKYKDFFCARKRDLETAEPLRTETLRALRPWPNHDDHFHFRFKCPVGEKLCVDQTAVPEGDGC